MATNSYNTTNSYNITNRYHKHLVSNKSTLLKMTIQKIYENHYKLYKLLQDYGDPRTWPATSWQLQTYEKKHRQLIRLIHRSNNRWWLMESFLKYLNEIFEGEDFIKWAKGAYPNEYVNEIKLKILLVWHQLFSQIQTGDLGIPPNIFKRRGTAQRLLNDLIKRVEERIEERAVEHQTWTAPVLDLAPASQTKHRSSSPSPIELSSRSSSDRSSSGRSGSSPSPMELSDRRSGSPSPTVSRQKLSAAPEAGGGGNKTRKKKRRLTRKQRLKKKRSRSSSRRSRSHTRRYYR